MLWNTFMKQHADDLKMESGAANGGSCSAVAIKRFPPPLETRE